MATEKAAKNRAESGTKQPDKTIDCDRGGSLAKIEKIGHDGICHCKDSAAANLQRYDMSMKNHFT